jgi:hypothetical protein
MRVGGLLEKPPVVSRVFSAEAFVAELILRQFFGEFNANPACRLRLLA